jgi:alpha-glucosidase (family GH31 glycosyl hydrolase)
VSDDIGSFLGPPPGQALDPPDLYDRWVQLGTFEPILRLHSNNGDRLPWQYPQPVRTVTETFLRLREALIPYTYTLASQAHDDGLPMTRPLYLDYPQLAAAYSHPDEYLYGPDMLVAPVTSPGNTAQTTVWLPPGRWVDFFTGATFAGPSTTTVSSPLSRMPVFVRAGGIIPEQSSSTTSSPSSPTHMVLKVFPGARGNFNLYSDSGSGLGYTRGLFTETPITDSVDSDGPNATSAPSATFRMTVGAAHGHFPGEPTAVGYRLDMVDMTQPSGVTLNGRSLPHQAAGSDSQGWSYDPATETVVVNTSRVPTDHTLAVAVSGTGQVNRGEPPPSS